MLCLNILVIFLIFLTTVAVVILGHFITTFQYWKKKGVPYLRPKIPWGNLRNPKKANKSLTLLLQDVYDELKLKGHKFAGIYTFTSVQYFPIHPEYVKSVMSKDFPHFVDRGIYFNEEYDPLSAHLLSIEGEPWRNLRQKLTPTFTTGKMKSMFKTLVDCGGPMLEAMKKMQLNGEVIDFKNLLACYTTDVIGSCAFGLDCNSFENKDSEIRKAFNSVLKQSTLQTAKTNFCLLFPDLAKKLNLAVTPRQCSEFLLKLVKETIEYRRKNNVRRADFLQILIDLTDQDESFTFLQLAAQVFIFFLAGFETSSSAMSFCLFELSQNRDVQEKLRNEIFEILEKNDGEITYEGVMNMQYLQQVVEETLRKYPTLPQLNRVCTKDYTIPNTEIVIEQGTRVNISVYGMQHDPEFFPDPEVFDPDRFSKENRTKIVPFTYLPFGDGPRACIGKRFGQLQTMVGIITVLKNYRLSLNRKTDVPLSWDPLSFLLSINGGIYLDAEKVA